MPAIRILELDVGIIEQKRVGEGIDWANQQEDLRSDDDVAGPAMGIDSFLEGEAGALEEVPVSCSLVGCRDLGAAHNRPRNPVITCTCWP